VEHGSVRVFITYDDLARRLNTAGANGGAVELAGNEALTPAAMDLVQQRNLAVHRHTGSVAERPATDSSPIAAKRQADAGGAGIACPAPRAESAGSGGAIGLVVSQPTNAVRGLIDGLFRTGLRLADYTLDSCWMANTRAMGVAIATGRLAGGVAVLPFAAEAMVLANKLRGIRAVQGTTRAAIAAALRRFDANVLIVEHAASTFYEIGSMIRLFVSHRCGAGANAALMATLTELERV
jgi:hypothetical protein